MTDPSPAISPPAKPQLDYPFESPPQVGASLEIVPGVMWMRVPLPFKLRVNAEHLRLAKQVFRAVAHAGRGPSSGE